MIQGEVMTERQYRQLEAVSQSMLRDFYKNRKKFYKEYVLKEKLDEEDEEKDTQAIKMGSIVHLKMLRPEMVDTRVLMSTCAEAPTGLMLKFCKELAVETAMATDEEGIIRKSFEEMAVEAYLRSGFKWNLNRVLEGFNDKDPERYYTELVAAKVQRKVVATGRDMDASERIVTAMRTSEHTQDFCRIENDPDTTVMDELIVTGFVIKGRPFKSMLDRLEINHAGRYIQPWDIKVVWAVENFYEEYYVRKYGYIQAGTYDLAAASFRDENYPDYEVRPMKYLVSDTNNYYNPLIYTLAAQDIVDTFEGFTHRGRHFKGIFQLIDELNWHMDSNIWSMSMENSLKGGHITLQSLRQP